MTGEVDPLRELCRVVADMAVAWGSLADYELNAEAELFIEGLGSPDRFDRQRAEHAILGLRAMADLLEIMLQIDPDARAGAAD